MNVFDFANFPLFVVDAFTKKPFSGNSAAVVLLPFHESVSKEVKQKIAAEMNLSETVFIIPKSEDCFVKGYSFGLEWFTPVCEVNLCGHATLASAAVLFNVYNNQSDELEFETLSGILKAKRSDDRKIEINLPAYNSKPITEEYDALIKAVVGPLSVKEVVISDSKKITIRLADEITREQLEMIKVRDDELLKAASEIIGVIVTLNATGKEKCSDDEGKPYDFISRYFAPWMGISEDPVTGSAHSVLAPYWSKILNKNDLYARQCSPRGGDLVLKLIEDRVHISGNAIVVIEGQIKF